MLHRFLEEQAEDPAKARREFDRLHPRGKMATIEEVASAFVFLASQEAVNIPLKTSVVMEVFASRVISQGNKPEAGNLFAKRKNCTRRLLRRSETSTD